MRIESINAAEKAAKDFLAKVKALKAQDVSMNVENKYGYLLWGTKYSSALRRSSMELTRALSKMRKP